MGKHTATCTDAAEGPATDTIDALEITPSSGSTISGSHEDALARALAESTPSAGPLSKLQSEQLSTAVALTR